VDVGAWWGPWTYWLARVADRVVACEPLPELAAFISRHAPENVHVENVALSDRRAAVPLWVPAGGRGSEGRSSLDPRLADGRRSVVVPTVRLDDLELQGVGFIKIDVEGHELQVLHGAAETIAASRPVLLVEVEDHFQHGAGVAPVFDFVRSLGYSGQFLYRGAWRDIDEFDVAALQLRWQSRVQSSGYLKNLLLNSRRYVNNFVFHPVGEPRA
jgi:FkbM family methyltransferase